MECASNTLRENRYKILSWTSMNCSRMYCDLNNGLKIHYSGHGLNNGVAKVSNSNGSVIRRAVIQILTVFLLHEIALKKTISKQIENPDDAIVVKLP